MGIEVSRETEARLANEARRRGISMEALLEQAMSERLATGDVAASELPLWHLGDAGSLHRRDICDDVG